MFFAMVLINFVIVIFWYEHVLQYQFKTIHLLIEGRYNVETTSMSTDDQGFQSYLKNLVSSPETPVVHILFDNYQIIKEEQHSPKVLSLNKRPTTLNEIHHILNSSRSPSTFLTNRRSTIFSLGHNKNQTQDNWVGVTINTSLIIKEIWKKEKIILLYIFFNSFILATVVFFRFRKIVFKPIDTLLNLANNYHLNEGDWSLQPAGGGEFDQLAQAMKAMTLRIEEDRDRLLESVVQLQQTNNKLQISQQETLQAEKLAATGRLAAGFAHEIGNPVAIVQGYLELVQQRSYSEDEKLDFVKRSLKELNRIDSLLFQLMDLSKNQKKAEQPVDPVVVIRELIETLSTNFSKSNTQVKLESNEKRLLIFCDRDVLRQVLLNFFLNSIDAIEEIQSIREGKIHCEITCQFVGEIKFVIITVEDNGTGIEQSKLQYIFDPFFTTKPVGQGTGLGLSVAHRLIESMNGKIEVDSRHNEGTTFTIYIPQYA